MSRETKTKKKDSGKGSKGVASDPTAPAATVGAEIAAAINARQQGRDAAGAAKKNQGGRKGR